MEEGLASSLSYCRRDAVSKLPQFLPCHKAIDGYTAYSSR